MIIICLYNSVLMPNSCGLPQKISEENNEVNMLFCRIHWISKINGKISNSFFGNNLSFSKIHCLFYRYIKQTMVVI